ncbi:ABC-2 family transporter protein [Paenibacillus sp. UNCCL117]|uniref:ABC-2 transporter permease n=1 Tax=unclassified Paenibacillus TaxID=185978 RepID=UPI00087E0BE6|nr:MULTISPECIES: ABC-2 transporter permease [unclassified Paenibacillus]SDD84143.1 ABC-2 family transporter protein [Paenibacillus sp. cl123]SFW54684.1 ABC-2 family transporter protein [Paenibacillus sp. UNCCL117]
MYNLLMKDLKLGVHPIFLVMPFLTGALMLIPGWIYFIVLLYFCWITIPNMCNQFRAQNDLMFTSMMPVTKRDMVKARVSVIVLLELLHLIVAAIFGIFTILLYPNLKYYFFPPSIGFWGLCLVMFAIFNLIFIPMFYKTAYKFGKALFVSITVAMLFAGIAQWIGIQSPVVSDIFYSRDAHNLLLQTSILIAGIVIFSVTSVLAYRIAFKRFLQVEI